MPTRRVYIPALDGLRFAAFLLVFAHHLPSLGGRIGQVQNLGWVGVHLFLTLSAYLLTRLLCAEYSASGTVSLPWFYVRRGLRIYPLYLLFVAAMFCAKALRSGIGPHDAFRLAGLLTFTDNIVTGLDGWTLIPYCGHLWTISLEEQFYLVLPLFLRACLVHRRSLLTWLAVGWAILVVGRVVSVLAGAQHPFIWTSLFSGDSLILGTFLGASAGRGEVRWSERFVLLGCCIFAIGSLLALPDIWTGGWHQVLIFTLAAFWAGALCVSAAYDRLLGFLSVRPLRYLGKISYGLYVFHLPAIAAAQRLSTNWLATAAIAFSLTLGMAALSFAIIERPFLRYKARFEVIKSRP